MSPIKINNLVWCPHFCNCCQGTSLHHIALMANGTYTYGSLRTVNNRESSTTCRAQQEARDPGVWSFCKADLSANHHDCGLRGGFLIKHASWADCNLLQRPQKSGAILYSPSAALQGSSVSWRGCLHVSGVLVFIDAAQGMPLDHVAHLGLISLGPTGLWQ